ncbi:Uncharacterized protein TPAR_02215 [Tolypocladium paradoxum]|uniref:Uncharacterized protein n=1 Tax=Tolypocladium paradoxum TaxID=94208 RepID=A0A2S4L568_9HYPO|nr:Uncharacterized protein TPAR_02215 [Tolypocladium paradoxum]
MLSQRQPQLRYLLLTTDCSCEDMSDATDLSSFCQLERLDWKAPKTGNFDSLRRAIRRNCTQLRRLEIDLVSDCNFRSSLGSSIGPDGIKLWYLDAQLSMPLPPSHRLDTPLLSNLQWLKLTSTPLSSSRTDIIDIRTLRSLILRKCLGWQGFLGNLLDFGLPTRLYSLEIQEKTDECGPTCRAPREPSDPFDSTLARFLGAFEGLQELFLGLRGSTHSLAILDKASRHQKTLRKLVLHQRGIKPSGDNHESIIDVPLKRVDPDAPDDVQNDLSRNPLVGFNLWSIGLGCTPEIMGTILLPFGSKSSSLRLVHIRQSGLDLTHDHAESYAMDPVARQSRYRVYDLGQLTESFYSFATWLFGPQGIPSVEALAFGDFAYGFPYNGMWPGHNFVLLRGSWPPIPPHFRFLELKNEDARNFANRHRRVLEACPTEQLIRPYRPMFAASAEVRTASAAATESLSCTQPSPLQAPFHCTNSLVQPLCGAPLPPSSERRGLASVFANAALAYPHGACRAWSSSSHRQPSISFHQQDLSLSSHLQAYIIVGPDRHSPALTVTAILSASLHHPPPVRKAYIMSQAGLLTAVSLEIFLNILQMVRLPVSISTLPRYSGDVRVADSASAQVDVLDLQSLSLACRFTYHAVRQRLWTSLVIRCESEYRFDLIPNKIPNTIPLHHVRALHVRSSFDKLPAYRCIHWDPRPPRGRPKLLKNRIHMPEGAEGHPNRWRVLMPRLYRIIKKFKHGQLLSFRNSWNLGICLPPRLVTKLAEDQPNLQSLEFITDSHCEESGPGFYDITLANVRFNKLRRLSWTGPPYGLLLGELVHPHVRRLEELKIDWPLHDIMNRGPMDRDSWLIPAIRRGTGTILYPITSPMLRGIQALCLCRIPLRDQLLAQILDFGSLKSLTFRDCYGWGEAVGQTLKSRKWDPLGLRTFEIQDSNKTWKHCDSLSGEWKWLLLLDFVEGLEELFIGLKVRRPVPNGMLWQHVAKHGKTLSKYVQHYRAKRLTKFGFGLNKTFDLESWGLGGDQQEALETFLASLDVKSLGLAGSPEYLASILPALAAKRRLRFLHIRQTGTDLGKRDSWAVIPNSPESSEGPYSSSHVSTDESSNDEGEESSGEGREEGTTNEALSDDRSEGFAEPRQITHGDLRDDFFDVISRAFGLHGIRSLDTVAFGDFAYCGIRTPRHSFILRRDAASKGGFRFVALQGWEGRAVVNEHRRLLEACPVGGLEDLLSDKDAKRARARRNARHALAPGPDEPAQGDGDVDMADWGEEEENVLALQHLCV